MHQYRHLDERDAGDLEAVAAIRWTGKNEDQLCEFLEKTKQVERIIEIRKIDDEQVACLGCTYISGRTPRVTMLVYPNHYVLDRYPDGLQTKPAEEFETYYNAIVTAIARKHLTDTSRLDE